MKRVVEPELMNQEEQSYAYAQADFTEPNIHFINLFKETFGDDFNSHALDLGCGNADITLRFAQTYPNCLVDGLDGSNSMLNYGRKALEQCSPSLQKRVRLILGIIPDVQLPEAHYDAVISNSLLHHLHNPSVLWQFIKTFGKKGTKVFIGDLFRPSSPEKAMEIVESYAKNEADILKQDFYNSLLAAFEISEIEEQLKTANLDYLSVKQISDRHVLVSGFLD